MQLSKLTSKGQMTLPASIRKYFELHRGDKLQCLIEGDHIVLIPAKGSVRDLKGMIAKPKLAVSIEDMNDAVETEAAERAMPR